MKIIVVSDKQASKFINNKKNLGVKDNEYVLFGDLINGINEEEQHVWAGDRWVDEPARLVVHNQQITELNEIGYLIAGLLYADHHTVIVGCDPYTVSDYLTDELKKAFGEENVILLLPTLHTGLSEVIRLQNDIREIIHPTTAERVETGAEDAEGEPLELDLREKTKDTA